MNTSWKEAIRNRHFLLSLGVACITLIILAFFMPYFFSEVIAPKKGVALNDFVLDYLPPAEWSWTIFTVIYTCFLLTMVTNYKSPVIMLNGLATFSLITWTRMLTIYLFTLEAPKGIIFLEDPFLTHVVYHQEYFVKDLFFSGHVSSMMVFVLIEPSLRLRWVKASATVVVAVLLLVQHVHYTLDIVAAPVATYLAFQLITHFTSKLNKP